jgi:hypothetical protein
MSGHIEGNIAILMNGIKLLISEQAWAMNFGYAILSNLFSWV